MCHESDSATKVTFLTSRDVTFCKLQMQRKSLSAGRAYIRRSTYTSRPRPTSRPRRIRSLDC